VCEKLSDLQKLQKVSGVGVIERVDAYPWISNLVVVSGQ